MLFSQAFPTLKLFHEEKLQTPDYAGDRTVDAFSKYLYEKADRVVSEIRAKGQRERGSNCLSVVLKVPAALARRAEASNQISCVSMGFGFGFLKKAVPDE